MHVEMAIPQMITQVHSRRPVGGCLVRNGDFGLRWATSQAASGVKNTSEPAHRCLFFFSSRRRHTRSVSAFLLNRSSDLSRNATRLNSRFKSLDTLKVKIISVTFRRVIRTNHKKASKIWRHENIQLGGCQS